MAEDKTPILSRDPITGDYIADFRIQVPAEFYQRAFFKLIEEENVDLTSPEALTKVIERVGIVTKWLAHPHAKTVHVPTVVQSEVKESEKPALLNQRNADLAKQLRVSPTHIQHVKSRMQEVAQHIPPYQWEETCLAHTLPMNMPTTGHIWDAFCTWLEKHNDHPTVVNDAELAEQWSKYRADIGRLRYDERKVLKMLHEEWLAGRFVLDQEAAEQERQYQTVQQRGLAEKLEVVAGAVNGNRFR